MKRFSRIIKGILLSAFAIGLFSLNTQHILKNKAITASATEVSIAQEADEVKVADYFINEAFAQADEPAEEEGKKETGTPQTSTISKDVVEQISQTMGWVHYIFGPAIFFFTNHIGGLMGTDYLFSGTMGDMLHDIWVISRNIVNIIFVLLLLYMAIKQIFFTGEGEGSSELKKLLPKFIIMLIAINFSWLAVRIVIDAANVATNVVFAIPSGIRGTLADVEPCKIDGVETSQTCMLGNSFYNVRETEQANFKMEGSNVEGTDKTCPTKEEVQAAKDAGEPLGKQRIFCWYTLDYSKFSKNNAAQNLTYGIAQIQRLTRANTGDLNLQGIGKVAMGFIFSIIFELIYLVAFFALFLAMIFRVAMLWFFIAFSPFLVLLLYLKELKEFGGGENDIFSIKALISWAFVPAKVGAVFAVGFIMISAGQSMTDSFLAKIENTSIGTMPDFETLFHGMDNVQELIWLLMTTLIVWMGVFAVLKKLKGVEGVFTGIQNYLQRAGTFAARAGYYAPIFPVGEGGEKISVGKMMEPFDIKKRFEKMGDEFKGPTRADKLNRGLTVLKDKKSVVDDMDKHLKDGKHDLFVSKLVSGSGGHITNETLQNASDAELQRFLKDFGKGWEGHTNKIRDAIKGLKTKPTTPGKTAETLGPVGSDVIEKGVRDALQKKHLAAKILEAKNEGIDTEKVIAELTKMNKGKTPSAINIDTSDIDKAIAQIKADAEAAAGAAGGTTA